MSKNSGLILNFKYKIIVYILAKSVTSLFSRCTLANKFWLLEGGNRSVDGSMYCVITVPDRGVVSITDYMENSMSANMLLANMGNKYKLVLFVRYFFYELLTDLVNFFSGYLFWLGNIYLLESCRSNPLYLELNYILLIRSCFFAVTGPYKMMRCLQFLPQGGIDLFEQESGTIPTSNFCSGTRGFLKQKFAGVTMLADYVLFHKC